MGWRERGVVVAAVLALGAAPAGVGCGSSDAESRETVAEKIARLELGMSRDEVMEIMGPPRDTPRKYWMYGKNLLVFEDGVLVKKDKF
jgi:hypothetical protein